MRIYKKRNDIPKSLQSKNWLKKRRLIPLESHVAELHQKNRVIKLYDVEKTKKRYSYWFEVPENLKTVTALAKMGLKPGAKKRAEVYGGDWKKIYDLYDVDEAVPKKKIKMTDARKKAIEKAHSVYMEMHTCPGCQEFDIHADYRDGSLCKECTERNSFLKMLERCKESAKEKFMKWATYRENYVILDSETTGLGDDDEIVEIAVIDMFGNVLVNTLVKPTIPIGQEAFLTHGIKNAEIQKAPSFAKIWPKLQEIFADKEVLIYNAAFDIRMMLQSLKACGFKDIQFTYKYDCIMQTYAEYIGDWSDHYGSFTWISLANATGCSVQSHRALDDCFLCLDLINNFELAQSLR